AEWRRYGEFDTVLIVDDVDGTVRAASIVEPALLKRLLNGPGDLHDWQGDLPVEGEKRQPGSWGALVLALSNEEEVLDIDPEAFWQGIYLWFRSRRVDYNSKNRVGSRA
ncbi:MAG: hypothetical protein WD533_03030, partial [Dehalococcoidia bacterium]